MPTVVRRPAIAVVIALLSLWPAAADAFDGQLINRVTGRPLAGADVAIAGLAGTVRTDENGLFSWAPEPSLPFVVIVILPGGRLANPVRVQTLGDRSPLVIPIEPTLVESITVSGSTPSVDAMPGTSATLVSSLDIERRAPATVVQALENVVGVSAVAEGQSAVPAIRGLARGRTLLLLDGGRLFSERRAGPSVSFIAPETLERIEVVRGPASTAYGSDAFGGVVSMITPKPAINSRLAASVAATYGLGVPAARFDADVVTGLGRHGGMMVQARHRDASEYLSPDGVVPNSAWEDQGALVRLSLNAGGFWTAAWQGDFAGDTGLPRSDTAAIRASMPFERSRRASVSFDRPDVGGFGHLTIAAFVGWYAQRLDQDRLAAPGRPRRIDRSDIDGTDFEVRATTRTAIGGARLTAGADLTGRRGLHARDTAIVFNAAGALTSTTEAVSIESANRQGAGAFSQVDLPLGSRVTTAAGVRVDDVRSENTAGFFGDRGVSHTAVSGSAAIVVRPSSSWLLTAQASSGFRDPTLSDRFFRGPVGRGFIVGNPDLDPERSYQFEAGARYDAGRWRIGASVYHYEVDNLIERYPSGTDTFLFRNRDRARVRGVEIDGRVNAYRGTVVDVSLETASGRATDGAALDDIAPARAIVQVRQPVGQRVFLSARVAIVARDSSPGPSEVATPGLVEAGTTASWRPQRWVELRLAAANLLNERCFSSPGPRAVLAAGRNASMTIVLQY